MYDRKQARLRRLRRVQHGTAVVKVIGGVQDGSTTNLTSLTTDNPTSRPTAAAAALYTLTSPPPPPPPDLGSSCVPWASSAVDLIDCVECAAELAAAQKQRTTTSTQRRRRQRQHHSSSSSSSPLRLSPPLVAAHSWSSGSKTAGTGFCTCVNRHSLASNTAPCSITSVL